MKFRKQKFGGMRPVCTGSPALSVSGGFNLDIVNVKYPIGAVIPEASLPNMTRYFVRSLY